LKAFDLLRLLIERRPAVVSKDEIQSHLWPTTFVSEANLPSLIAEIRTALGDTARQPRFIRTVHGFGYAFCGQTEASGAPVVTRSRYSLVWEAKQLALGEGDNVVGRDRDLTVSLDSSSVSRRHCVIRVAGDTVTVEDLDSKNGTFVRDERIAGLVPVASGDRIRVGTIVLTLLSDESTLTETQTTHDDDRR
jgi:hypothetical protein